MSDGLTEILSRNEFRPRGKSLLERFSDWLGDILDRVLDPIAAPSVGSTSVLDWLVVAFLAAMVVVVVVRLTRTVRSGTGARRVDRPAPARTRSARAWLQEAEAHEREGAWRQALRCRYRELLATLVERRVVTDIEGRTSGEYRSEACARLPHIAEPFADATELFEAAWYGNEVIGPNDTVRFRALADRVLVLAGRRPGVPDDTDNERPPAAESGAEQPGRPTP